MFLHAKWKICSLLKFIPETSGNLLTNSLQSLTISSFSFIFGAGQEKERKSEEREGRVRGTRMRSRLGLH
jgi:hypothetical protein